MLFRLVADINASSGKVLRPIGTEEYPFNAIFDGVFYTITMQKNSAISGQEYTGLFGYVAENAVIKNFLFDVQEGASIGSVNSYVIGSLIGYNQGTVSNVFVNLATSLTYNSGRRFAGECVGCQSATAPRMSNVWISVLNGRNDAVGNMTGDDAFGINELGILGNELAIT